LLDNHAINTQSLEKHYGIRGSLLQKQYKNNISDFREWGQKIHAKEYLLFPENIGASLSLDETAFSNGELYTILTNKAAKGKKGSIILMVKGTRAEHVMQVLRKISKEERDIVKEITLDMAGSMNEIARKCFTKANRVTDRFHVQKLTYDAVQEIRIRYRWEALDLENEDHRIAKLNNDRCKVEEFENGDTRKQLLARSRYLLFKHSSKWSDSQKERAIILFREYPDLEKAHQLAMGLGNIYEQHITRGVANTKMALWFQRVEQSGFQSFKTIKRTFETHHDSIMNFFDNRSTNASAESFNSKIKDFRRVFRGVKDIEFFLFRLTNIFA
jgi:transposase